AAYLLKQQGYDVTCAFMRNWDSLTNDDILGNPDLDNPVCSQEQDYNDAKSVADKLDLELLRVDFIKEYWDEVFQRFLVDYKRGRTPNPDILCNQYIKFDSFLKFAHERGFRTVATGHYAKTVLNEQGSTVLGKADDRNKDQSYFLAQINRNVLPDILFPLGDIEKPQVRRIAQELSLSIAEKKDSTGICFIGERNFRQFLSNYLPMKSGPIIDIADGRNVGTHKGVLYYTIGQRKGLDIGGTGPYYVIGKNVENNQLYVTDQLHQDWLYSNSCIVTGFNYLQDFAMPLSCHAKFRYRQEDNDVMIEPIDETSIRVAYPQMIRSVTPGQEAVFYLNDSVLGGGTIDRVFIDNEDLMQKINRIGVSWMK
ncbi:MAG: tRNA 2-thiouridine(34) synthase MnmA, partial [Erysipelotrichia bacterium]|nr:tRNA 2-thiouridine(34) synthase MnmA [Erysipelotrichia bacterium]